ncbi:MAG: Pectinesterase [Bacteroidetes bacterium]|nr:Pectinesterase [Bacteroidota bacterium]
MRTLVLLCLILSATGTALAGASHLVVTVVNPAPFERPQETIVLAWKEVVTALPALAPAGVSVFDGEGVIPSQLVDADADGVPEELLFQSTFAPAQRKQFTVRPAVEPKVFPPLVDAQFVLPRQDMAWENDRIAFRIYGSPLAGDVRNGIDVWTKRVRALIVQKWYKESEGAQPGKDTYHVDRGEGADFFSVGKSLGAGGCGIWRNDTLYQPGIFSSHRVLSKGPIRVQFRVVYDNGFAGGLPFHAEQTVTLDAGQNLNRIEIVYSGQGASDTLSVAAGLVKRKNVTSTARSDRGWIAFWGPVNDDSTNGFLGTGIVMPASVGRAVVEDAQQHMVLGSSRAHERLTYYAGAAWTRSGDVAVAADWHAMLDRCANGLRQPLKVTMKASGKKP